MRWLQYRSAVCDDVLDMKKSHPIAVKPACKKGTLRWTGVKSKRSYDGSQQQAFPECLGNSVPIHLHTKDTHAGRCLKELPSRWVFKDSYLSLSSKYIKQQSCFIK